MAKQLEMMYEGKAKQVFATDDPTLAVIHYKDDATAFNGLKKGTIVGKGVVNNLVSNHLFNMLEKNGIETHLVQQLNERDVYKRQSISKMRSPAMRRTSSTRPPPRCLRSSMQNMGGSMGPVLA